jgi:very-short-patch-repair endonuclease
MFVRGVLDDLESVAIELYPGWLPDAESIAAPGGAGLAAVRALALRRAAHSQHFGPFLGDLAAMALSGSRSSARRFPQEIRAAGLARVLADGFHRRRIVLLVQVPAGLRAAEEQALVAGSEWLAERASIGVWLTGAPVLGADWLATAATLPAVAGSTASAAHGDVVGNPHPRSTTEAALENALAGQEWATGRMWNQSYQSHALTAPVRLDLLWRAERCVVEIDGPEHCEPSRFDADRQRDVRLQLDGYAVLRFTNARVRHDVDAVVRQIGTFIQARRSDSLEGRKDGEW